MDKDSYLSILKDLKYAMKSTKNMQKVVTKELTKGYKK